VSAVLSEVLAKDVRVFADVAEVDGASTGLEEKETVEVLEEHRVRLVDRAEDGLTGGGELAEKTNDVVGGLTIETAAKGRGCQWREQKERETRTNEVGSSRKRRS
jgi:hypothetical protein